MSDHMTNDDGILERISAAATAREVKKEIEIEEAEAAKPLAERRTNSPAEAKIEMERARAEIEATLGMMRSKVTREVDEVKWQVHHAKRTVQETVEDVKRTVDIPERLRDKVRTDPWRTLAVAAGVGLGLALLTSGKKRGYDTLTKDEIDEIRGWRQERRRHMQRLEILTERAATANARPSIRQRIRARLAAGNEDD